MSKDTPMDKIMTYFRTKEALDKRKKADIVAEKQCVHDAPLDYVKAFVKSKKNLLDLNELKMELGSTEKEATEIIQVTKNQQYTNSFANENMQAAQAKIEEVAEATVLLREASTGVSETTFNESLSDAFKTYANEAAEQSNDKLTINLADPNGVTGK